MDTVWRQPSDGAYGSFLHKLKGFSERHWRSGDAMVDPSHRPPKITRAGQLCGVLDGPLVPENIAEKWGSLELLTHRKMRVESNDSLSTNPEISSNGRIRRLPEFEWSSELVTKLNEFKFIEEEQHGRRS